MFVGGGSVINGKKSSLFDSPWYWAYVFATAALIGLVLIGPKYAERQARIEFKSEGRQRAAMNVAGRELPPPSESNEPRIQLWPLYIVLVCLVTAAGWHLSRRLREVRKSEESRKDRETVD